MDEKQQRIIEGRLKLRERFLARIQETPSLADPKPLGSGPPNRHGMPQIPVGQKAVTKWPVLDLGIKPDITKETWSLTLDGAVKQRIQLDWSAFMELEQIEDCSDFHCVTTWSALNMRWKGVSFSTLAALVEPLPEATHILCYGADGYTTNLSLVEAMKDDVLLVHTWEDQPLPHEHGGPVRMITPQLYAWKGSKWIERIRFLTRDEPGFWEMRGYSMTAYPWRDDRYSR
jgi:DMSO/TMAO reductase YedYZ molybdopterin-dependent catalytic subunit